FAIHGVIRDNPFDTITALAVYKFEIPFYPFL
ncbi:hypothetical protein MNBD_GAMMA06-1189, partial [hydrothermal vent metagenome]